MNWDQVKGNWKQFQGKVKEKWGKLTDDDLTTIAGKRDQMAGKLQERYGYGKEQAEREINDWAKRLKVYSAGELTALRDDVASLSASVGELVRREAAVSRTRGPAVRPLLQNRSRPRLSCRRAPQPCPPTTPARHARPRAPKASRGCGQQEPARE